MFGEKFVVRIYTWSGKGQNKRTLHVGTGYPISPTLLLTAKHVIEPNDRDDNKGIRIIWSAEHNQPEETLPINDKTIVYDGHDDEEQYDLVLLHCKTPLTEENTPNLATIFPQGKQDYECCGFPIAGVSAGKHDAISVPGCIVGGHHSAQLTLITETNMNDEAYWGGLSGAPVFIGDQLYGVVKIKYKTIEKYLYATSIPYLMHNSDRFQQAVRSHQQASLKALTDQLHKKLIDEISDILDNGNIPLALLSKLLKLGRGTTVAEIAAYVVEVLLAHKAIQILAILSKQIKERKKRKGDQWQDYLFDVKQLCGWLLINSIDPKWWLRNEQGVLQPSINKLSNTIPLEKPAYIEVVISRSLLQQAQYTVDEYGNLLPDKEVHDPILFDGASEEASDIQILSEIFKDLRGTESAPPNVKTLLEGIKLTAPSLYNAREEKIIYYIISQSYLELLQEREWYSALEQAIGGYLQFICCDAGNTNMTDQNTCNNHQASLLETAAIIMRLK